MSVSPAPRKRKRDADHERTRSDDIEVDLEAPEPPSKKALRKARKNDTSKTLKGVLLVENQRDSAGHILKEASENKNSKKSTAKRSPYGIWIGNLPFSVTAKDIRTFLSTKLKLDPDSNDHIARVHMPSGETRNGKPQNKGFAYIDFGDADVCQGALRLSESLMGGRRILIKESKNFEGRPEEHKQPSRLKLPPSRRVFVGNLRFDTTTEELQSHFERCGSVSSIHIATFEDSGKCKGFAWVTFDDVMSAENAMRGFVHIRGEVRKSREDVDGKPGEDEEKAKDGEGNKRRIWVNRIGDRKLRVEYAEDATTRYKKRFGSHATKEEPDQEITSVNRTGLARGQKVDNSSNSVLAEAGSRGKRPRKEYMQPGYGRSSVQKIQGAIVKGEGAKITFD